jgi:hypothetical protein
MVDSHTSVWACACRACERILRRYREPRCSRNGDWRSREIVCEEPHGTHRDTGGLRRLSSDQRRCRHSAIRATCAAALYGRQTIEPPHPTFLSRSIPKNPVSNGRRRPATPVWQAPRASGAASELRMKSRTAAEPSNSECPHPRALRADDGSIPISNSR